MTTIICRGLLISGLLLILTSWRLQQAMPAANTCQAVLTYIDATGSLHAWHGPGHDVLLGGKVRGSDYTGYQLVDSILLLIEQQSIRRTNFAAHSLKPWLTDASLLNVVGGQIYFTQPVSPSVVLLQSATVNVSVPIVISTLSGEVTWLGASPDEQRIYLALYESANRQTSLYELTRATDDMRLLRVLAGNWTRINRFSGRGAVVVLMQAGERTDYLLPPDTVIILDAATGYLYQDLGRIASTVRLITLAPDGRSLLIEYAPLTDPTVTRTARVGLDGSLWQDATLPPDVEVVGDWGDDYPVVSTSYDLLTVSFRNDPNPYEAVYRYDWTTSTARHLADIERSVWRYYSKTETSALLLIDAPIPAQSTVSLDGYVQLDPQSGAINRLPISPDRLIPDWWADTRQLVYVQQGHLMTYQVDSGATQDWGESNGSPKVSPCRDVWVDQGWSPNQRKTPLIYRREQPIPIDRLPATIDPESWYWWLLAPTTAFNPWPLVGGGALLMLVGLGALRWRGH